MKATEKAENVIGPSFVRDLADAGLVVVDKMTLDALKRLRTQVDVWMAYAPFTFSPREVRIKDTLAELNQLDTQ